MPCSLNEFTINGFASSSALSSGSILWPTNTIKLALLNLATQDDGIRVITGATNASPISISNSTFSPAFQVGELVSIANVGGNLGANGIWRVGASPSTDDFTLVHPVTGANSVGTGSYTSGGVAINLSQVGSMLSCFNAGVVSTAVTLAGKTVANQAILDATDPTFPTVAGLAVSAMILYKDSGSAATSPILGYYDGFQDIVAAATAATSATTIWVNPLLAPLASGVTLTFSNGQAATTSAIAAAGATSITVNALSGSVPVGNRASGPITSSGLPFTPDGTNVNVTVSLNYFLRLMNLNV